MVRGLSTFKQFHGSGEGIATNILSHRLQKLEVAGIVTAEIDETDARSVRYRLTEKGIDLAPVLLEFLIWGARHERTAAPCALIEQMARIGAKSSWKSAVAGGSEIPFRCCRDLPTLRTGVVSGSLQLIREDVRQSKGEGKKRMSKVRVLVGTRKGAFILTSDGKREKWDVSGPHFAGWEIYHLKGSPVDPNRLYASQTSGWFGQMIQRFERRRQNLETPGGETMPTPAACPRARATSSSTTLRPKPASRSPRTSGTTARSIPGNSSASGISSRRSPIRTRSTPAWKTPRCSAPPTAASPGRNFPACAATAPGPKWQPGAGGMCLHTIILDPSNPDRIYIAISAAGAFRTDDGGKTWKPINQGLRFAIHSRSRPPRSATAFTTSPCTRRAPTCCSCRSIGT